MPKINIDELCEPIELIVDGQAYTVTDISQATAIKMGKLSEDKDEDVKLLADILAEILGAEKATIAKLGMRKRAMLIKSLMGVINEELEAKNVPKAVVPK